MEEEISMPYEPTAEERAKNLERQNIRILDDISKKNREIAELKNLLRLYGHLYMMFSYEREAKEEARQERDKEAHSNNVLEKMALTLRGQVKALEERLEKDDEND